MDKHESDVYRIHVSLSKWCAINFGYGFSSWDKNETDVSYDRCFYHDNSNFCF